MVRNGILLALGIGWASTAVVGADDPHSADRSVSVSNARRDEQGFLIHDVDSPYQAGKTQLRVLLPEGKADAERWPVIYLLPVEAGSESRYGDGLREVKVRRLHEKHQAIFVAPTFSHLPWYADHPTDPALRQETYLVQAVVPYIENAYPARRHAAGRLLLGFSKSGWGAWSLLLRRPETFGRAAAWDAPLMMDRPGPYGSGPIFGTPENFEKYRLSRLWREQGAALGPEPRLLLAGYGGFRAEHQAAVALLRERRIPHEYRDGPQRKHDWHSGWVEEAVEWLLAKPK